MPSNTPPNDAKISAAADQLASLEVAEDQANAEGSDTSTNGAARPSEEGKRVLDPELWKPHPPTEDCPVCFVPLPVNESESTYYVCCGKLICGACMAEKVRATRVINAKRAKKKLPPLGHACAFCRTEEKLSESRYEERIRKCDGRAACNLACKYRDGDARMNIAKDEVKSLELFHHAADDLGYSKAMMKLGSVYRHGLDGVPKDQTKGWKYVEDAVKMGDAPARSLLGAIEAENGNIKLALRHCKLAAAAGVEHSVKMLWKLFYKGDLEKAELEETLRIYKEACDSMNSEERERYALLKKAQADGDDLLRDTLRGYYRGEINAKQLRLALKVLEEQT